MSTGNLSLDILLGTIENASASDHSPSEEVIKSIKAQFPVLNDEQAADLYSLVCAAGNSAQQEHIKLVLTAPPSFAFKAQSTKNTVVKMLSDAKSSITLTGYSLSEYFNEMIDLIVQKSQMGVFVKFYVNNISSQKQLEKLLRYKGNFLKIYSYECNEDQMSALHAKVITVDNMFTLITSANLSYHGQLGNIELGTLIESPRIAKEVDQILTTLLFSKVFREI